MREWARKLEQEGTEGGALSPFFRALLSLAREAVIERSHEMRARSSAVVPFPLDISVDSRCSSRSIPDAVRFARYASAEVLSEEDNRFARCHLIRSPRRPSKMFHYDRAGNASDKLDATRPDPPRVKKSARNNMRCCSYAQSRMKYRRALNIRARARRLARSKSERDESLRKRYARGSVAYSRLAGNVVFPSCRMTRRDADSS